MERFKFKNSELTNLLEIKIECEGIKLVSISASNADDVFREFTQEITTYMIPSPPADIDETMEFISQSRVGMKDCNDLVLAIKSHNDEFLGCVGFHGRGKCHTPELGIWLKKSAHGNGFGKAAVRGLLRWASENIEFEYVIYPVDRANIPSRKIPESMGGTIFKEVKVPTMSGGMLDEVVYRVLA